MRNPALSRVVRGLSSRTSVSALIAGLVIVVPMAHVMGQAFRGTVGATQGQVSINRSTPGVDNIFINSSTAVIDWAPDETGTGTIDFLPAGTSANYSSPYSGYTVLNRVVPTVDPSRAISLNGTVNVPNGNVWFYSPGGILVGSTATFNVGGLLLTSSMPNGSDNNTFLTTDSSGKHFSLAPAANGSFVSISAGALIDASAQSGSYVALIAPSVTQSGMVKVNGSAAYVAARAADITINQGLFDISVTMPTEEPGPQLIHDGSTGMTFASGTAPGVTDTHRVYLVSVPKNDAITLLVQGGSNLGFDIAGGATVSGSAIILSAGRNITDATSSGATPFASGAATAAKANIAINTGTFSSAVTGSATHNAIVSNGGNTVNITFASDLTLIAPNLVSVGSATAGQSVTIGGNLTLDASINGTTDSNPVTAGTAQLFATGGGGITVGGTATLLANATGNGSSGPVSATGGTAQITSFGGAIDITGATDLEANAFSGSGPVTSAPLTLTGGLVNLQASGSGASLHFHDVVNASVTDSTESNPLGSDASGSTAAGISAQGGTVTLQNNGGGALTADGFVTIEADGLGQSVNNGPAGGAGTGGTINITAADAGITLADGLQAFARGYGGDANTIDPFTFVPAANGGSATGGQISIGTLNAGGSLVIGQSGSESVLNVAATALGGSFGVAGGAGMGGQIHLTNNGGTTHIFVLSSLDASGSGGVGVMSGKGTGGLSEITSAGSTTFEAPVDQSAKGEAGASSSDGVHGPHSGDALGGTAQVVANGTGTITFISDATADVSASVPTGDVSYNAGGNATGGTYFLTGTGTAVIHAENNVSVDAHANGGDNRLETGATGTGMGGKMFVDAQGASSITIDNRLSGNATGGGGTDLSTGNGGAGTGGTLSAGGGSGQLTIGSVSLVADGQGGDGIVVGGNGSGGNAAVHIFNAGGSIHVASSVDLSAQGLGGAATLSQPPSGVITTGGTGTGGSATVDAEHGSIAIGTASTPDSYIMINTNGSGGQGVNGGIGNGGGIIDPSGGSSIVAVAGSVIFTPSTSYGRSGAPVTLISNGLGGLGNTAVDGSAGQGGAGTGGFSGLQANNTTLATDQSLITMPTTVNLVATGTGGGGGSNLSMGIGGTGGVGTGGETFLNAQAGNGEIVISGLTSDAGGLGGIGGGGATGGVGGAGFGGNNQTGVLSSTLTTYTQGVAQLGAVTASASGLGGAGGTGMTTGGVGGAGQGGNVGLNSRGATVNATSAQLTAVGQGGGGGSGQSATGAGGNGTGGNVAFQSTYRPQTSVVGTMNVSGQVVGIASGLAGTGSTSGQTAVGTLMIEARGGALSAGTLFFSAAGTTVPANAVVSEIGAIATGTITANSLTVTSGGDIGLYFDQGGTLTTPSSTISARSITPFGDQDTATTTLTGTGTFFANSMTFNVQQDFRTTASFATPGAFTLAAPGAIQTGAIGAGGAISLNYDPGTMTSSHGTSVSTGNLTSGGNIVVRADGATTVGNVNAGLGINLNFDTAAATHGTSLTTGDLISARTVLLQTDGNASIGKVTAADSLISVATGVTAIGDIRAGQEGQLASTQQGYVINVFSNGGASIGATAAAGEIRFGSLNGSITAGDIFTQRDLIVLAAQNVSLGLVSTAQAPTVGGPSGNQATNPGGVYIGHSNGTVLSAAQTFATDPTPIGGSITIAGPVTTGLFDVAALGNMMTGLVNSLGDIQLDIGGTITTGILISGERIRGTSGGSSTYGALVAGDNIQVQAGGDMTVASASAGRANPSLNSQATYEIGIRSATNTSVGVLTAKGNIGLLAQAGNVTTGNVTTDQSFVALSANKITTGGITTTTTGGTGAGVYLANASMYPLVADDLVPATLFAVAPTAVGGSIQIGGAVSTSRFAAAAAGTFTSSAITASDLLNINFNSGAGVAHGAGLTTGDLTSGKLVLVQSDGNINTGAVTASDSLIISSTGGTTTLGNLSTGQVNPPTFSGQGYSAQVFATNGSSIGAITAKGEVRLQTLNGSVATGDIVTGRDLVVLAKQNVSLGAITTNTTTTATGGTNGTQFFPGGVYIGHSDGTNTAASTLFTSLPTPVEGSITINGTVSTGLFETAAATTFTAQAINATDYVNINAGGPITLASLSGNADIDVTGNDAFTAGSVNSGQDTNIKVLGQITVGTGSAGLIAANTNQQASGEPQDNPDSQPTQSSSSSDSKRPGFVLVGGAGVTLGSASSAGDVGLVSSGNVSAGALTTGFSVGALVGGNLALGTVTTGGGANGLYIGNVSLYPQVSNSHTDNAADILFSMVPPPPIGGSILITGPVSVGRFAAASAGAFTANGVVAASTDLSITSGDLATFNGAVTAPTIAITSGDLTIGSSGSLGSASTTSLQLTSTNAQTTVGSTTTGASTGQTGLATTYTLDNAEFGRLRAQQIGLTAAGNVTLATLNINGSASSSGNLVGSAAQFQVQTPGSIRVVGSVNLANAATTDTLNFIAGNRFEIATDTGQLQLLGADGKVGGIAAITAANIAVGTSSLLSQLANDPKFVGRDSLLASAPLAGANLNGYLRAGQMNFTVGNTLLIQNSGSGTTLAGFTVGSGGIKIANSGKDPIDVVIYGRAFDSSGTEIPTASIGSAVTTSQTSATSNVDGCVFATNVCSPVNTGASVQTVAQTQLVNIASSIQAAITGSVGAATGSPISNGTGGGSSGGGNSKSGNSDDGGDEPAAKGNPAAVKPNVLIDTNSIGTAANVQVDTPVTSSGNTSLWIGEDGLSGVDSSATGNNP